MARGSGACDASAMDCMYGLSAEVIAERAGVDVSTARRWKAGTSRLPRSAQLVLEADLGAFSPSARGWRIRGELLISPEGWEVSLSEVRAVPLMRQQIATYQLESRIFRNLEPQPEPGSIVDPLVGEPDTGERVLERKGL